MRIASAASSRKDVGRRAPDQMMTRRARSVALSLAWALFRCSRAYEELPAPGFGTDLPDRDLTTCGFTPPHSSERSAPFEHQPCQVWQGAKNAPRPTV